MNKKIKNFIGGILVLLVTLFALFTIQQCSTEEEHQSSSSSQKLSSEFKSEESSSINSYSSLISSEEEVIPGIDPEEPAEIKTRAFSFNENFNINLVYDLFSSIFNELPNMATPSITYQTDNILINKSLTIKCPVCEETVFVSASLKTKGILEFDVVGYHSHIENIEIDLAKVFFDYLSKDSAVLIGINYKNDFGIIKKNNTWYFQFLGLNLPIFKNEIDIRTEVMLEAFGDLLIEGITDLKGDGFDLTSQEIKEEELKNAIPLLFYKNFATYLIKYNCIEASQKILDKASADAEINSFDLTYLKPDISVNENIAQINRDFEYDYLIGKVISDENNYYFSSSRNALKECFNQMFLEANPEFIENDDIEFIDGVLTVDNGSSSEGSVHVIPSINNSFFPFFNSWSLTPTSAANRDTRMFFANDDGKIACLGGINYQYERYFDDEYSHETNIDQYFFNWGITDSYYFILDYMTENCYLKEARLSYANTFNQLTKTTVTIDENVLVKNYIAEDVTEDSTTTLYGKMDKSRFIANEIIQYGFELKINNGLATYLANNYTTGVSINDITYQDDEALYFFVSLDLIEDDYEVRSFVEYTDKIEYSKWG